MFEKFQDYMYYLLYTPLKKVRKSVNQWYILFITLGKLFDKNKEAFFKTREESMVATSYYLLNEHARDRGLSRFEGENIDNYRKRIATYPEVCKLGGTNTGVIRAVKALGYEVVELIPAYQIDGHRERWSEFYIFIYMNIDEQYKIGFYILQSIVRKTKYVGAKDNYRFLFLTKFDNTLLLNSDTRLYIRVENHYQKQSTNDLNLKLKFIAEYPTIENSVSIITKNNLWFHDGAYLFDGTRIQDAYEKDEVI